MGGGRVWMCEARLRRGAILPGKVPGQELHILVDLGTHLACAEDAPEHSDCKLKHHVLLCTQVVSQLDHCLMGLREAKDMGKVCTPGRLDTQSYPHSHAPAINIFWTNFARATHLDVGEGILGVKRVMGQVCLHAMVRGKQGTVRMHAPCCTCCRWVILFLYIPLHHPSTPGSGYSSACAPA